MQFHEPISTTVKLTRPVFIVNYPVVKFNERSLSSLGKKRVNAHTSLRRFAEEIPQIGTKNAFILRHSLNTRMTSHLNYSALV